ncbi:response regulator transcription factor [Planococcus citreus]|uniref:Two-component system OmpR family response regulator n=1 Tax=Planococcus citreus TaxID=1373 RepID=A0A497YG61_9BACL|nr:response regulator transcription factor [Planococcus citreus]RLJ86552.1 two-component system OmpR family response regulator [Planococcus citreus]
MNILVIDDEQTMRDLLARTLNEAGYLVQQASTGERGIERIREGDIDFVILDIMMAGQDGFSVCRQVREFSDVPILMLTAIAGSEADKINGLRAGADDYLIKPFSRGELLARIEAILRRAKGAAFKPEPVLSNGRIELNETMRRVTADGKQVTLTRKEFDLLALFLAHPGQVFSREQLMEKLWGEQALNVTTRTVDTHIKTLRIKLGDAGAAIETVWGLGYKVVAG